MEPRETREVEFFGKITAEFTHEMKNVLAIIKESSGLMEDIIAMGGAAAFPRVERMSKAIATIMDQVQRGVDLSTRLNRFAHSPDVPITTIELSDTVEQLMLLTQRFARLKNVSVSVERAAGEIPLLTSPLRLQMALFHGMQLCCAFLPSGGRVTLRVSDGPTGSEVAFNCEGERGTQFECLTEFPAWTILAEVVEGIEGSVRPDPAACGFVVCLPRG